MAFRNLIDAFKPGIRVKQPDPRITVEDLGVFSFEESETEYVSHDRPGCPRNAVIEYFKPGNFIRCAWCFQPLTSEAASHVMEHAEMTAQRTFCWLREKCQTKAHT